MQIGTFSSQNWLKINLYRYLTFFLFPADIYDNFKKTVKPDDLNVTTRIMGGGWLEHGDKSILVEGVSIVS